MIIIGLTGSIGMGKSSVSRMLRRLHIPVFDADAVVHRLQGPGGAAVADIKKLFPETIDAGAVHRQKLARRVLGDAVALKQLEQLLHPLVRKAQRRWLGQQQRVRAAIVVLDVPLLFEKGGWRDCDLVMVVSAPLHVQTARVLARPGMTAARLAYIRALQWPDARKRRQADIVLPTGLGFRHTLTTLRQALHRQAAWRND